MSKDIRLVIAASSRSQQAASPVLVATAEVVLFAVLLLEVTGAVLLEDTAGDGLAETGDGEGELGEGVAGGGGGEGTARLASATADCCRVRSEDTGDANTKIRQDARLRNVCSQKKQPDQSLCTHTPVQKEISYESDS